MSVQHSVNQVAEGEVTPRFRDAFECLAAALGVLPARLQADEPPREPKFSVQRSSDDQYYFNLIAENNQKLLTSDRYASRSNADEGIAAIRVHAQSDTRYDRRDTGPGSHTHYYFVLKDSAGEPLGASELYATQAAREEAIEAVKRNAPAARVDG